MSCKKCFQCFYPHLLVCFFNVLSPLYMFTGTMKNQLFLKGKKKAALLDGIFWVSAPLLLLHSSSVWSSSSSCGRFRSSGFVQSCSTPSGGNTEQVLHFCKTNQTGGDNCWLREFVLISTALHCKPTWLFCLSHHTKICVSSWVCVCVHCWRKLCGTLISVRRLFVFDLFFIYMKQRAWSVNVSGEPAEDLKTCFVVWQ